jgi:hypothetical protein
LPKAESHRERAEQQFGPVNTLAPLADLQKIPKENTKAFY